MHISPEYIKIFVTVVKINSYFLGTNEIIYGYRKLLYIYSLYSESLSFCYTHVLFRGIIFFWFQCTVHYSVSVFIFII